MTETVKNDGQFSEPRATREQFLATDPADFDKDNTVSYPDKGYRLSYYGRNCPQFHLDVFPQTDGLQSIHVNIIGVLKTPSKVVLRVQKTEPAPMNFASSRTITLPHIDCSYLHVEDHNMDVANHVFEILKPTLLEGN
ncbi:hypothetical protein ACQYWY_06890 [Comamonas sediminis]|uniref:hypothetical protein n=1 Tax=Comamonas sediminis TaxID=1783360 RepID=UPI003D27D2B9